VRDRIVARLSRVPGLVAAYLFGSRARGTATSRSDIDLAMWLAQRPSSFDEYPFDVAADLEQELGVAVDLVVLNGAPSDLMPSSTDIVQESDRAVTLKSIAMGRWFTRQPVQAPFRKCDPITGHAAFHPQPISRRSASARRQTPKRV
jgi:predicted nucleotidyltransferase